MTTGDFSRWLLGKRANNFNGILYQQGRVLSDSDGTTQTRLVNDWQHIAGSDIIGRHVAAIPSDEPNSFKIGSPILLDATSKKIIVNVDKGRVWVDGMIVHLENEDAEVTRVADYLGTPYHNVPPELPTPGTRDAVILEIYQDAINAFQLPNQLLEPALGGPDTIEMLHTSFAFRLLRLSQDDTCSTIPSKLQDDVYLSNKGRLTVSLQKNPPVVGECPVEENYGYTGITHNLYRIEIAEVNNNSGPQKFKWSRFNGGLVGRGNYTDPVRSKIRIIHNMQAILWSGLTEFYLEIINYDEETGYFKTAYGTIATLNSQKELELSAIPVFGGANPPPDVTGDGIFFRLWDGIRDIDEFTADTPPTMLIDGIHLKFDLPTPSNYHPMDYWLFEVRAGGIKNDQLLVDDSLPHGIHYHRVPLSIIEWSSSVGNTTIADIASAIEDCRVIFQPLTELKDCGSCCCSISVGDGVSSHGDYDSLQDAINSIGNMGGEICLLPGKHNVNVIVANKKNLIIRGCGSRTKVENNEGKSPIITIHSNSEKILIEKIDFVANKAVAILMDGMIGGIVKEIKIKDNTIRSVGNPESIKAIVEVINGIDVTICENNIILQEGKGAETGIYLLGSNITVNNNIISAEFLTEGGVGGGVQIGNGSVNINLIQNKIVGGSGNGITLGDPIKSDPPSFIYHVNIDGNEIANMGLSGIGVPRLLSSTSNENDPFQLTDVLACGVRVLDLQICGNHIHNCLQRTFDKNMIIEVGLSYRGMPCRGFGGILLTSCEKVIIKDNKIEDNGKRNTDPVCGIFIFSLSEVQIVQNYIFNNGPIHEGESFNDGPRGGVVLIYGTGRNIIHPGSFGEDYAIRVHDNVISQPMGRALVVWSAGMISVVNNYFNSELYDSVSQFDIQSGCISIFNPGIISSSNNVAVSNTTTNLAALQFVGGIIFECNQLRLGQFNSSTLSNYIVSEFDLSFGSNQVNCLNSNIQTNTFLRAATLRAHDNRLKETKSTPAISLYSMGTEMNNTSNNQGDHCIIALKLSTNPIPVVNTGNQVKSIDCQQIHNNLFSRASEVERSYE